MIFAFNGRLITVQHGATGGRDERPLDSRVRFWPTDRTVQRWVAFRYSLVVLSL
jgi:hypothetical protein